MKRTNSGFIVLFSIMMLILSSCSVNKFSSRKNYQPRVRIEASNPIPEMETTNIENSISIKKDSVRVNSINENKTETSHQTKPKETLMEKVVKVFFPKKKELFAPVLHPQTKKLNKVKHVNMDDDQITGLVVSLIAIVMAITALFMLIGMAHGNLYVFFVVGLIFATIAIIMGFVARKTLPFKGISLAAGIVGVLALVLIFIFLLLIAAFGIIF